MGDELPFPKHSPVVSMIVVSHNEGEWLQNGEQPCADNPTGR